ncbi:MAG: DUF2975 domain-containing protein [Gammaproteobacteria bacterium]
MTVTQSRIKKISTIFRILFQVLFVVIPVVHIFEWINVPESIDISWKFGFVINAIPKGTEILHPLSTATKLYGFLLSGIPIIIIECIVYFLIKLFRLYEAAEIFTLKNIKYIKKIGYSLLIVQIINPICQGFLTALLTWGNPHGHRVASITISGTDLVLLLTAFIVILISWIMAEGCRLHEEQQLTI